MIILVHVHVPVVLFFFYEPTVTFNHQLPSYKKSKDHPIGEKSHLFLLDWQACGQFFILVLVYSACFLQMLTRTMDIMNYDNVFSLKLHYFFISKDNYEALTLYLKSNNWKFNGDKLIYFI